MAMGLCSGVVSGVALSDRHMRIERIGLEHHGKATLGRIDLVDAHAAQVELSH